MKCNVNDRAVSRYGGCERRFPKVLRGRSHLIVVCVLSRWWKFSSMLNGAAHEIQLLSICSVLFDKEVI